jgi:uncharacterized protein YndB with AHSA1/START domain
MIGVRGGAMPGDRTVTVTRLVRAPRRAVYRALLELDAVAVWRVPQDMSCVIHEFDPREGGTFRLSLTYATPARPGKSSDATDTYHGRFERLVPDAMVRETIEFETDDPSLQGAFTETVTLADAPGGTDVVVTHEGLPAGVGLEDDERGCTLALEQLARLVEAVDHPAHEVRRFLVTTTRGSAWDGTRPIREQAEWEAHAVHGPVGGRGFRADRWTARRRSPRCPRGGCAHRDRRAPALCRRPLGAVGDPRDRVCSVLARLARRGAARRVTTP